jgi:hypothetical protein
MNLGFQQGAKHVPVLFLSTKRDCGSGNARYFGVSIQEDSWRWADAPALSGLRALNAKIY